MLHYIWAIRVCGRVFNLSKGRWDCWLEFIKYGKPATNQIWITECTFIIYTNSIPLQYCLADRTSDVIR
jgi:hypothetical protein